MIQTTRGREFGMRGASGPAAYAADDSVQQREAERTASIGISGEIVTRSTDTNAKKRRRAIAAVARTRKAMAPMRIVRSRSGKRLRTSRRNDLPAGTEISNRRGSPPKINAKVP